MFQRLERQGKRSRCLAPLRFHRTCPQTGFLAKARVSPRKFRRSTALLDRRNLPSKGRTRRHRTRNRQSQAFLREEMQTRFRQSGMILPGARLRTERRRSKYAPIPVFERPCTVRRPFLARSRGDAHHKKRVDCTVRSPIRCRLFTPLESRNLIFACSSSRL